MIQHRINVPRFPQVSVFTHEELNAFLKDVYAFIHKEIVPLSDKKLLHTHSYYRMKPDGTGPHTFGMMTHDVREDRFMVQTLIALPRVGDMISWTDLPPFGVGQFLNTIFHEYTHVRQTARGRLIFPIEDDIQKIYWYGPDHRKQYMFRRSFNLPKTEKDGVIVRDDHNLAYYHDLPWEVEARVKAHEYVMQFIGNPENYKNAPFIFEASIDYLRKSYEKIPGDPHSLLTSLMRSLGTYSGIIAQPA